MISLLRPSTVLTGFVFMSTRSAAATVNSATATVDGATARLAEDGGVTPHTVESWRLGIIGGDQSGGPVRYNTIFPDQKSSGQPASYYHAQAFYGIEVEWASLHGAWLLSVIRRRDLAHGGIASRVSEDTGQAYQVNDFNFSDTALIFGWTIGEVYREAIWSADLSLVYDRGSIDSRVTAVNVNASYQAHSDISALSMRGRLRINSYNSGPWHVGFGPEFHLPIWNQSVDRSDAAINNGFSDRLQFTVSPAMGIGVTFSYIFS